MQSCIAPGPRRWGGTQCVGRQSLELALQGRYCPRSRCSPDALSHRSSFPTARVPEGSDEADTGDESRRRNRPHTEFGALRAIALRGLEAMETIRTLST